MAKSTTTFSLRLTDEERVLLEREAKRLAMKPAALARMLLVRSLQSSDSTKSPTQLRQLSQKIATMEETLSRVDVNLFNSVVLGLRLATGEEKLKDSAAWVRKHLRGE